MEHVAPVSKVIFSLEVLPVLADDIFTIMVLSFPLALLEELTLKDLSLTSILWTLMLTLFRLCQMVALLELRAEAAGVWLLLPAGDWDLSLWGDEAGDFLSPSFFLQTAVLCELVVWQWVQEC